MVSSPSIPLVFPFNRFHSSLPCLLFSPSFIPHVASSSGCIFKAFGFYFSVFKHLPTPSLALNLAHLERGFYVVVNLRYIFAGTALDKARYVSPACNSSLDQQVQKERWLCARA